MKTKIQQVKNWSELAEFVESINPYKQTIVLCGWINQIVGDKTKIQTLVFETRPVEILKENGNNGSKPETEGKITTESSSSEDIVTIS